MLGVKYGNMLLDGDYEWCWRKVFAFIPLD